MIRDREAKVAEILDNITKSSNLNYTEVGIKDLDLDIRVSPKIDGIDSQFLRIIRDQDETAFFKHVEAKKMELIEQRNELDKNHICFYLFVDFKYSSVEFTLFQRRDKDFAIFSEFLEMLLAEHSRANTFASIYIADSIERDSLVDVKTHFYTFDGDHNIDSRERLELFVPLANELKEVVRDESVYNPVLSSIYEILGLYLGKDIENFKDHLSAHLDLKDEDELDFWNEYLHLKIIELAARSKSEKDNKSQEDELFHT
jgi:hypothetical protein